MKGVDFGLGARLAVISGVVVIIAAMAWARRLRSMQTQVLKSVVVTMTGSAATCSRIAFVSTSRPSSASAELSEKLARMPGRSSRRRS